MNTLREPFRHSKKQFTNIISIFFVNTNDKIVKIIFQGLPLEIWYSDMDSYFDEFRKNSIIFPENFLFLPNLALPPTKSKNELPLSDEDF